MSPVVIVAGISLALDIWCFINGELTDKEKEKQKKIDNEIESIRECFYSPENQDKIDAIVNNRDLVQAKKKSIVDYLKKEAKERENDIGILLKEINDTIQSVKYTLHSEVGMQTNLRRSSLELLIKQLEEAKAKAFAYRDYLELYQEEISKESFEDERLIFSWKIPKSYLYEGKIIWINSVDIEDGIIKYDSKELHDASIYVDDYRVYDVLDNSIVPIMITAGKRKKYYASLEKGAFKGYELVNTHLGVTAVVKELCLNHILLVYKNSLELYLSIDNLIKRERCPLIQSSITVYPIKWEYNLSKSSSPSGKTVFPVYVSERRTS